MRSVSMAAIPLMDPNMEVQTASKPRTHKAGIRQWYQTPGNCPFKTVILCHMDMKNGQIPLTSIPLASMEKHWKQGVWTPMELELQVTVSCPTRMLEAWVL